MSNTETDSQIQRKNFLPVKRGKGQGWIRGMRLRNMYKVSKPQEYTVQWLFLRLWLPELQVGHEDVLPHFRTTTLKPALPGTWGSHGLGATHEPLPSRNVPRQVMENKIKTAPTLQKSISRTNLYCHKENHLKNAQPP